MFCRLIEFVRYAIATFSIIVICIERNHATIQKGINAMSRKTNASQMFNRTIVFPCVLKTIIAHTHDDDATFTKNDKQIRSTLRATFRDDHVKNTSWIASNMRDYDRIRRAYDRVYDTSCVERDENAKKQRAQKRVTKTRKSTKDNAQSNVETTTHDNVDAWLTTRDAMQSNVSRHIYNNDRPSIFWALGRISRTSHPYTIS